MVGVPVTLYRSFFCSRQTHPHLTVKALLVNFAVSERFRFDGTCLLLPSGRKQKDSVLLTPPSHRRLFSFGFCRANHEACCASWDPPEPCAQESRRLRLRDLGTGRGYRGTFTTRPTLSVVLFLLSIAHLSCRKRLLSRFSWCCKTSPLRSFRSRPSSLVNRTLHPSLWVDEKVLPYWFH
jgi:hypothetical protein